MDISNTRGRDTFQKWKKLIMLLVRISGCFSLKRRKRWLVRYRNTTGKAGLLLRYVLLKSIARSCGDNVSIFEGVYLNNPENMDFGDNVSIHPMCYLEGKGGIVIGNDVSIAHGTSILSTTHVMDDLSVPIKDQGITEKRTIIHDNVWLGCKVTVLCGTEIGSGSVVGANSVVTKTIQANCVYAGAPAKCIRSRV